MAAIGAHGRDVLAIVATAASSNLIRSSDDGRTWSAVADAAKLFGPPAPSMGRPSVTSLRWGESGFSAGGASEGYAAVWISPDGARCESVLAPGNAFHVMNHPDAPVVRPSATALGDVNVASPQTTRWPAAGNARSPKLMITDKPTDM